jgi:hypothetical protein
MTFNGRSETGKWYICAVEGTLVHSNRKGDILIFTPGRKDLIEKAVNEMDKNQVYVISSCPCCNSHQRMKVIPYTVVSDYGEISVVWDKTQAYCYACNSVSSVILDAEGRKNVRLIFVKEADV